MQGYGEDQLRKSEDILARAKDMDEAITEFRRLENEPKTNGNHLVARGEPELIRRLSAGWTLVQPLSEDRFLMQKTLAFLFYSINMVL